MADNEAQLGLCLVVEDHIGFNTAGVHTLLVCAKCGSARRWLLCSSRGSAWATCTCGERARHPALTPAAVEELARTPEAFWSSFEDAEAGFIDGSM